MKLHTVHKKKAAKELVGRKRKTAQEKGKKHHLKAAFGLGDPLGAREDDLIVIGDEAISLGLVQILLRENRRHLAGRDVRSFPLPILFFCARCFMRIYDLRMGAMQEIRGVQRLQQWRRWRKQ
jgi:hypothetical protein